MDGQILIGVGHCTMFMKYIMQLLTCKKVFHTADNLLRGAQKFNQLDAIKLMGSMTLWIPS